MRYMMFLIPGEGASAAGEPGDALIASMLKYNEDLARAGVLLALEGLHPTQRGARVAFGAGGRRAVTDGPFAEAREVIGGFWMIQARSKEEAVEWARRCPAREGDVIELRQVRDLDPAGGPR